METERAESNIYRKSLKYTVVNSESNDYPDSNTQYPSKPSEEARSRRTVTFLSEEEYEKVQEVATRNGLSISAVAHKLLVQSLNSWH
jgi:hypothetical protein